LNANRRVVLRRLITVMLVFASGTFVFILLNGTLGFNPLIDSDQRAEKLTDELAIGDSELRRAEGELIWISYLSTEQMNELAAYTDAIVRLDTGCAVDMQYCGLSAETGQTGIQFRWSESPPPQVPIGLPWSGGFVNPVNGAVYDLLGRAYQFQGEVAAMTIVPLQ